ncbi:MAG: uroporphyrinogen decarboxylase [Planctomycetes bacterium]|nr:uroporphyrinogen decarboxylase [Planctomycetota bacterium]
MTPREAFLAACRRQPVARKPSWLMRQAGRYMPEYQAVRGQVSFLDLCKSPELCRDVTMQPIEILGLDIGIIFSDILLPAEAMGQPLDFSERGPVLGNPVRDRAAIEALADFDAAVATPWPAESIRLTREVIGDHRALLGFCGAPFTLASYMVEGGGSRNYENIKRLMYGDPGAFELLLDRLTDNLHGYLRIQAEAGADALQIFDSWGGALATKDYARFVQPRMERLIAGLKRELDLPIISYVNGCSHLLELMADSGADVLAIDWKVEPAEAIRRVGDRCAIQGNMDPCALLASPEAAAAETRANLEAFGDFAGHIFNLGSGVLKWTPVACAQAVVDTVKDYRPRGA